MKKLQTDSKDKFAATDMEITQLRSLLDSVKSENASHIPMMGTESKEKGKELEKSVAVPENKFAMAHDVYGMVAAKVAKHRTTFSLVGAKVKRVHARVHADKHEMKIVKDAVEKII